MTLNEINNNDSLVENDAPYIEEEEDDDSDLTEDELVDSDEKIEESLETENVKQTRKLDYTLKTPEERNELVTAIINETPPEALTPRYLEILSDYIIFAMDKEERKQKKILTDNRMVTVNKRETSYEGLCGKLENGEDGIYNMISDLGKNTILTPKDPITEEDVEKIPELKELREAIARVEEAYKKARGKQKFLLKKQIIEMRQDQYVIRSAARGGSWGPKTSSTIKSIAKLDLYDKYSFDKDGNPVNDGVISFFNPDHIEALLCNYSGLKESAYGRFEYDLYYLMEDLDNLVEKTLKEEYPLYYDLLIYKIDGKTNVEIQELLERDHGIKHSVEYISSLWRNKIPKLLAEQAQLDYLKWYYTFVEYGKWKKCTRCGEIKLAHNRFFSKNKSSKDGWYSICKCCRNANSKKNLKKQAAKNRYLGVDE